jgi:ABC-type sugar transport system ATPase subunit
MSFLEVENISRKYNEQWVVHPCSFMQKKSERIAIVGETGSGKSTLMKMIGGIVQPDSGSIYFEGKRVTGPDEQLLPGHPMIGYLSQHFELHNNYRVEEILDYGNELPQQEAEELFRICQIDHLLNRKTNSGLSGGERQRIALAKILCRKPKLLLLDEPYSNLDRMHQHTIREVIESIASHLNITCMQVSHDGPDVLSWADRILVMRGGKIIQDGTPNDVYFKPINEYAAGLLGAYNFVSLADAYALAGKEIEAAHNAYLLRPEHIRISHSGLDGLAAVVKQIDFHGNYYLLQASTATGTILMQHSSAAFAVGDHVYLTAPADALHPINTE